MLASIIDFIVSIGPFALSAAGGPAGVALALFGFGHGNPIIKWIAIGIGAAIMLGTVIWATVWIEHLKRDRVAYRALMTEFASLRTHFECDQFGEPDLKTCIATIEAKKAAAQAAEIARQRLAAAAAQAQLDQDNRDLTAAQNAEHSFIVRDAVHGDGPVAPVLSESFARERIERGLKP